MLASLKKFIKQDILHQPVKVYKLNKVTVGRLDVANYEVPVGLLNTNSIYYGFGAGEDISFDIAIADKYQCNVFIFDPTPRAVAHYNQLVNKANGQANIIPEGSVGPWEDIKKENLDKLHYQDIGIWKEQTTLKFYEPKNAEHVSHSVVNLQHTEKYFEAKVNTLTNIMKELNHHTIDFLKVDIEGAEYDVIRSIIAEKPDVKVMNFEFDEIFHPQDVDYYKRIINSVKSLERAGYLVYSFSELHNIFEFIRRDVYEDLKRSSKN